jgi:pentapeptide MXKDX repeat protein
MTGTRAIDCGYRVPSLVARISPRNHSIIRRIEIMQKQIRLLFVTAALLFIPATLPTFAQDKMKGKDKIESKDKMKDDKMEGDKAKGDKMKDDKMEGDKMESDKMKGKKTNKDKKQKTGDKMDDKMEEKKP